MADHRAPRPGRPHHLDGRLRPRGAQLGPATRRDDEHPGLRRPLHPRRLRWGEPRLARPPPFHRPARTRPGPAVLYNSWEATGFDVDQAGQCRLADLAAGLGVELFVLDDGWFGARTDDRAGLGDWTPRPEAFPDGLRPLADHVHGHGMAFGVWVEPEMVNADSDLYRAHPDWVIHAPTRDATELRHQLVLNLARPEVEALVHSTLDRLVTENDVDWLKWDANRPSPRPVGPATRIPTGSGSTTSEPSTGSWTDCARPPRPADRGLRRGGGRVDLAVLARTDQAWTSDNTDPVDRISVQHGFSQLFPAQSMAAWVTDSPNGITGRSTPCASASTSPWPGRSASAATSPGGRGGARRGRRPGRPVQADPASRAARHPVPAHRPRRAHRRPLRGP
ncbi:alpha-galactosidase [Kitasatospora aburaviensis]